MFFGTHWPLTIKCAKFMKISSVSSPVAWWILPPSIFSDLRAGYWFKFGALDCDTLKLQTKGCRSISVESQNIPLSSLLINWQSGHQHTSQKMHEKPCFASQDCVWRLCSSFLSNFLINVNYECRIFVCVYFTSVHTNTWQFS